MLLYKKLLLMTFGTTLVSTAVTHGNVHRCITLQHDTERDHFFLENTATFLKDKINQPKKKINEFLQLFCSLTYQEYFSVSRITREGSVRNGFL